MSRSTREYFALGAFVLSCVVALWWFLTQSRPNTYYAVAPHHLLTADAMDRWYRRTLGEIPDLQRVIIISPSHFARGRAHVQSVSAPGTLCWSQTCLMAEPFPPYTSSEDGVFPHSWSGYRTDEHGIGAHMVFLKKYVPNVEIIPIVLHRQLTDFSRNSSLSEQLHDFITRQKGSTLIVASVDFSHHVPEPLARYHDLSSIASLDSGNLSHAEVDCRNCLDLIVRLARLDKQPFFHLSERTSVDSVLGRDSGYGNTSHILGNFSSKNPSIGRVTGIAFWDTSLGRNTLSGVTNTGTFFRAFWQEGNTQKQPPTFYHRALQGFDTVSVNLETSLSDTPCGVKKWPLHIQSPTSTLSLLKDLAITHVSLANNHFGDCDNRSEAIDTIRSHGLLPIIEGQVSRQNLRGITVSHVAFSAVENPLWNLTGAVAMITDEERSLHPTAIIVQVHAGREYAERSSEEQRLIAYALIDAGADLVIMHHTHTLLESEQYRWKKIYYGLGNFLFDQNLPQTLTWGAVVYSIDVRWNVESQLLSIPRNTDFSVSLPTEWRVAQ